MLELRIQLVWVFAFVFNSDRKGGRESYMEGREFIAICVFLLSHESLHVGAEKGHIRVVNKSLLGVFQ